MKTYMLWSLVFALSLGGAVGCSSKSKDQSNAEPPPVTVSLPVEKEVTDYSDYTGRTAAVDSVEVRARVWGYLDKVHFKEGALVKKGEVLFDIDPRNYEAVLAQTQGSLSSAEIKAERFELEYKRAMKLKSDDAIAQQEYDKAVSDRGEAVASVLSLKGKRDQAKLDVEFTKVTAPVTGRVGRAIVTEGNLVQSGQSGGTLLTTIVSVDPMYVYYDVDERSVLRVRQLIREGKVKSARDTPWSVFLGLANDDNYPYEGTIDFVDNQVNPKTGTLRLRGVFPNKNEALSPGYFARIRMPIGYPHRALLISDRAVDTDQGDKIVYIVDAANKVDVRKVRLGSLHDGLRVVEEGLKADDRVIVTGLQQVRPGLVVTPTVSPMPRSHVPAKNS